MGITFRSPVSSQSPAEFPVSWAALAQAYAEAKSGLVIIPADPSQTGSAPDGRLKKSVRHHSGPHQGPTRRWIFEHVGTGN